MAQLQVDGAVGLRLGVGEDEVVVFVVAQMPVHERVELVAGRGGRLEGEVLKN